MGLNAGLDEKGNKMQSDILLSVMLLEVTLNVNRVIRNSTAQLQLYVMVM